MLEFPIKVLDEDDVADGIGNSKVREVVDSVNDGAELVMAESVPSLPAALLEYLRMGLSVVSADELNQEEPDLKGGLIFPDSFSIFLPYF